MAGSISRFPAGFPSDPSFSQRARCITMSLLVPWAFQLPARAQCRPVVNITRLLEFEWSRRPREAARHFIEDCSEARKYGEIKTSALSGRIQLRSSEREGRGRLGMGDDGINFHLPTTWNDISSSHPVRPSRYQCEFCLLPNQTMLNLLQFY